MQERDDTKLLLRRWFEGDREAVAELLERDREWLERELRGRRGTNLRRLEETGDAIQELILRVLEYSPRFVVENRGQFRRLLVRMVGNLLADRGRGLQRRPLHRLAAASSSQTDASRARLDLTGVDSATAPPSAAARSEELGWIRIGLEFLPPPDRRLIRARTFEEQGFEALGNDLGLSVDAVRMRFQRGLLRLTGIVRRLQDGELDQLLAERDADNEAEDGARTDASPERDGPENDDPESGGPNAGSSGAPG